MAQPPEGHTQIAEFVGLLVATAVSTWVALRKWLSRGGGENLPTEESVRQNRRDIEALKALSDRTATKEHLKAMQEKLRELESVVKEMDKMQDEHGRMLAVTMEQMTDSRRSLGRIESLMRSLGSEISFLRGRIGMDSAVPTPPEGVRGGSS